MNELRVWRGTTAGKTTHTETDYDQFGNVTRSFDAADDGTADDVETTTGYSSADPACVARGIVGLPDRVDVRATASGETLDTRPKRAGSLS